mmetsp:Transcript_13825/g.45697  ORF Transcript_13825/g.45697 Transcript_13825/m.45697 type:complete len:233 (-) Transcript_13825:1564-2262(-)
MVLQSCAKISGALLETASHCGAVKNFNPPPAVLIATCRLSQLQSQCVIASGPASAFFAEPPFWPSNVSPAKSETTSVWSTSLYPQYTSKVRNRPSPDATPRNFPQGEYFKDKTALPSGACCPTATVVPVTTSVTITLPQNVPTATWSHPSLACGCHATDRPLFGSRACRNIFRSFNDQTRTLLSSPTVAKCPSLGCIAMSQTSPSSIPDLWSIAPQCACNASFAVFVAWRSF